MSRINRTAHVIYSPHQMFELVRDVQRYPEFLSWVRKGEIHEQEPNRQLASLEVRIAGVVQRLTTENGLIEPEQLSMRLVQGPFQELSGIWRFQDLAGSGTRVSLDLAFRLHGSVLMLPFRRGFGLMADRLVDDFCRRAEQIHG